MENTTRTKLIGAILLVATVVAGIYFCRNSIGPGANRWGHGKLTVSEGMYYLSRMHRVIKNWQDATKFAEIDEEGRFKASYRTLLVIDTDKQAIWIEKDGHIQEHNYTELPAGIQWEFSHITPQADKKLSGRTILMIRGFHSNRHTPERFSFVAMGRESYIFLHFDSSSLSTIQGTSSPKIPAFNFKSLPKEDEKLYGSLIVTDAEYQQYRRSFSEAAQSQLDEESSQTKEYAVLEEKKVTWQKNERRLYVEIDRQVRRKGYKLRSLTVEPGPDFTAGHTELRGRKSKFLRRVSSGISSVEAYLNIDYLGDNIWYARSEAHPLHPIMPRRELELEFLVCPEGNFSDSGEKEFLTKGRQKQQQFTPVSETPWQATLSNETVVEFIGICENPSAGKQWWGPDGSPLDDVPYMNAKSYARPREDRKVYEFAWRIHKSAGGVAISYSTEGCKGSYGGQIRDRYGNQITEGLSGHSYGFNKSRSKTSFELGFAIKDWQTALTIEDAVGETKFLGKQRILLIPPVMENGQIIVRCYEEYRTQVGNYQTDFGLIYKEDSVIKTVSLRQYEEDTTVNQETGLREHTFTIDKMDIHQIEGICFRYRPLGFVTFKNITLIPGKNQGFEIELNKQ